MKSGKFTVASLFCGIGGLDLGFTWAGFNVVWANDFMRAATDSYIGNFGSNAVFGDINQISLNSLPDVDVIIGGPPCQSFSLVGQRRVDDDRGGLVFRFLEAIRVKRPRAFVMENVPGMAASKINGRRLTSVLQEEFEALGYSVLSMKLDASEFLVPQKRKRLFLVGSLCGLIDKPDPAEFAIECYGIDILTYNNGAKAALGDLGVPVSKGNLAEYNNLEPSRFARLMRRDNQDKVSLHEHPRMSDTDKVLLSFIPPGGNYMDVPDEFSTKRILNFKASGGRTTTYARLHPDFPSYTVNTYFRRPNVGSNFHYGEPRLITAREAMRLQSIPDYFNTIHSSQDARNTLIGNAVPPLLAHAVAWSLKKTLCSKVDFLRTQQLQLI